MHSGESEQEWFELRSYSSKSSRLSQDLFDKQLRKCQNDVDQSQNIRKPEKRSKKKVQKTAKGGPIKLSKNFFNFSRTKHNQLGFDEDLNLRQGRERNSDRNNCKKVHSVIHQILKRDQRFEQVLKVINKDERYRLDYFVTLLIQLAYIDLLPAFAPIFISITNSVLKQLEQQLHKYDEQTYEFSNCQALWKKIKKAQDYLAEFEKGNMVEGLEILFDENLRNQKFIKASEQKIKKFLKNKCLPNM